MLLKTKKVMEAQLSNYIKVVMLRLEKTSKRGFVLKKTPTHQFIEARKSSHVFFRKRDVSFLKRRRLGFHASSEVLAKLQSPSQSAE